MSDDSFPVITVLKLVSCLLALGTYVASGAANGKKKKEWEAKLIGDRRADTGRPARAGVRRAEVREPARDDLAPAGARRAKVRDPARDDLAPAGAAVRPRGDSPRTWIITASVAALVAGIVVMAIVSASTSSAEAPRSEYQPPAPVPRTTIWLSAPTGTSEATLRACVPILNERLASSACHPSASLEGGRIGVSVDKAREASARDALLPPALVPRHTEIAVDHGARSDLCREAREAGVEPPATPLDEDAADALVKKSEAELKTSTARDSDPSRADVASLILGAIGSIDYAAARRASGRFVPKKEAWDVARDPLGALHLIDPDMTLPASALSSARQNAYGGDEFGYSMDYLVELRTSGDGARALDRLRLDWARGGGSILIVVDGVIRAECAAFIRGKQEDGSVLTCLRPAKPHEIDRANGVVNLLSVKELPIALAVAEETAESAQPEAR